MNSNASIRLLVLDRDGVINRDSKEFVKTADEWQALPGSIDAIARLTRAGFAVTVASNQSGLARGLFDLDALTEMHAKLNSLVLEAGGSIEHIAWCPHGPDDDCHCRKPKPGLLEEISARFDVPLKGVPVIGDSLRDLQAALSVSARPILVRTGNGKKTESALPDNLRDIEVFDNLAAAADVLVLE